MNQIKRARIIEGLTQTELAELLGISNVSVCKWESGQTFPSTKRLKQVAEALHTTVADLIDGHERMTG